MTTKFNFTSCHGLAGVILLFWLLSFSVSSQAAPIQSAGSIRAALTAFVTEQTGHYGAPPRVKIGRLDPRLRLSRCSEQISAFQPPGTRMLGNTTIGIRCSGSSPWTIYVPAYVQIFRPVALTARPLNRGDVVSAADIKMVERDLATLRQGYFIDSKRPVGKVLTRRVGVNTVITPQLLEAPRLVRRGEQVVIIAEAEGIEIRATGKALGNGARGDLIRVKNSTSKKTVEAVVTGPGVVKVRTGSQFR